METNIPKYGLEKLVWTASDFDRMGWHDCYIHAFHSGLRPERGEFDFLLDLDYIVRWIEPQPPETFFSFDIAPATFVFHNAHSITVRLNAGHGEIVTDGLNRRADRLTPKGIVKEYHWVFEPDLISLWATGFTQYFRRTPIRTQHQRLELEERGGVSFAKAFEREV